MPATAVALEGAGGGWGRQARDATSFFLLLLHPPPGLTNGRPPVLIIASFTYLAEGARRRRGERERAISSHYHCQPYESLMALLINRSARQLILILPRKPRLPHFNFAFLVITY
jgi:hypothetical protein